METFWDIMEPLAWAILFLVFLIILGAAGGIAYDLAGRAWRWMRPRCIYAVALFFIVLAALILFSATPFFFIFGTFAMAEKWVRLLLIFSKELNTLFSCLIKGEKYGK